nr:mannosyl-oligosaccharide 1,2-alpha-mannosidase IB-like [Onthophagus taurus]
MTATGTGILPSYQRFANGAPIAFARKSFRSREKCVVVLVFLTFGFVCFGTFFFLPDFRAGLSSTDSVYRVYDQIKRAGPEFLLPPPPPMDESPRGLGLVRHNRDSQMDLDPHVLDDREKLRAKIESDGDLKVLERPDVRRSNSQEIKGRGIREDQIGDVLLQGFTNSPYIIRGGEDSDRTARERRNKVKEVSFSFYF